MSEGAQQLLEIVKLLYPYQKIVLEYNVAERGGLFIDIYLPGLRLGFEYDGVQHFKFNPHFHGTHDNFVKAQKRDYEKDDRCQELGVTLIRVAYNEDISVELVQEKIEEALDE